MTYQGLSPDQHRELDLIAEDLKTSLKGSAPIALSHQADLIERARRLLSIVQWEHWLSGFELTPSKARHKIRIGGRWKKWPGLLRSNVEFDAARLLINGTRLDDVYVDLICQRAESGEWITHRLITKEFNERPVRDEHWDEKLCTCCGSSNDKATTLTMTLTANHKTEDFTVCGPLCAIQILLNKVRAATRHESDQE